MKLSIFNLKNAHLIISIIILSPIALNYGIIPDKILPVLFDFKVETIDLKNVFRAIMGLYLGIIYLWFLGVYNSKYWIMATVLNVAFMGGLAFGRLISIVLDGHPSIVFKIGFVVELILAIWGVLNLRNRQFMPQ